MLQGSVTEAVFPHDDGLSFKLPLRMRAIRCSTQRHQALATRARLCESQGCRKEQKEIKHRCVRSGGRWWIAVDSTGLKKVSRLGRFWRVGVALISRNQPNSGAVRLGLARIEASLVPSDMQNPSAKALHIAAHMQRKSKNLYTSGNRDKSCRIFFA